MHPFHAHFLILWLMDVLGLVDDPGDVSGDAADDGDAGRARTKKRSRPEGRLPILVAMI